MADPKTRAEVIAISGVVADEFSIPHALLLGCLIAESNLVWNSRRPTDPSQDAGYWPDVSGGVGQQTVKYDPDYHGGSAYPGPTEVARVLELQYDVKRSAQVAAANLKGKWNGQTDDASLLATMAKYNWPAGGGAFYTPAHEANYRRGLAEAHAILGVTPVPVTYNPNEPAIAQNDPWSCAPTSTRWAMTALGRHPAESWMENQMKADGVVSETLGLLDASGAGLAAWVIAQYGEFQFTASNDPSVSFDDVAAEAGKYPLLLGGRSWGHWSGVRGLSASSNTLLLANPADGWMGVGQTMNRQQFAALGPFSMVRVTHPDLAPAPTPPTPPPADELAALRAENERLRTVIGYASHDIGAALDKESASIRASLGALDSAISTLKGQS